MTKERLSEEEFSSRFKARMLEHMATLADGSSVAGYADRVANDFWKKHRKSGEPPEHYAEFEVKWCKEGNRCYRLEKGRR